MESSSGRLPSSAVERSSAAPRLPSCRLRVSTARTASMVWSLAGMTEIIAAQDGTRTRFGRRHSSARTGRDPAHNGIAHRCRWKAAVRGRRDYHPRVHVVSSAIGQDRARRRPHLRTRRRRHPTGDENRTLARTRVQSPCPPRSPRADQSRARADRATTECLRQVRAASDQHEARRFGSMAAVACTRT